MSLESRTLAQLEQTLRLSNPIYYRGGAGILPLVFTIEDGPTFFGINFDELFDPSTGLIRASAVPPSTTLHDALTDVVSGQHHVSFVQADADLLYEALGDISVHAAIAGVHHAKYLDSAAIAAVEGEPTLDLSGAVGITGDLTLSAAILLGKPGIEDDDGVQRITFRGGAPFFGAVATTFKLAVGGNTVIIEDGDLRMDDGDVNIQANKLRSTSVDMFESSFSSPTGLAFRVQPRSGNNASALEVVPSGTSAAAFFSMFNDSGAADANRVRFGVGTVGLAIDAATGLVIDLGINSVITLHMDATDGYMSVPMRFGDTGAATEDLE
ncbi:hypothetical protein LCGC14_2305520, partial [marine sediment metagenome]